MELNEKNYYSQEADKAFMSVSQYKRFADSLGRLGCGFTAMEELYGRWEEEPTTAMLIGQYADSYYDWRTVWSEVEDKN